MKNDKSKKFNVQFYSDFSQLKYVFAEIVTKLKLIQKTNEKENSANKEIKNQ